MKANKSYMVFNTSGKMYGIPVDNIRSINYNSAIIRMSGLSESLLGLSVYNGMKIPVVDFNKIFYDKKDSNSDTGSVIIVELISNPKQLIGIMVDQIKEIIELTHEQIVPIKNVKNMFNNQLAEGFAEIVNKSFCLIVIPERIFVNFEWLIKEHMR